MDINLPWSAGRIKFGVPLNHVHESSSDKAFLARRWAIWLRHLGTQQTFQSLKLWLRAKILSIKTPHGKSFDSKLCNMLVILSASPSSTTCCKFSWSYLLFFFSMISNYNWVLSCEFCNFWSILYFEQVIVERKDKVIKPEIRSVLCILILTSSQLI